MRLTRLLKKIFEIANDLSFTILEIGALPIEGQAEPFHQLLDYFPASRVLAFEVDKNLCDEMNRKSKQGFKFYPVALGRTEESCVFYQTNHPMCSSLYKPNEKLIKLYNNLEVASLKSEINIDTVSLDYFVQENDIHSIDFIKIDIQGAELDTFKGGIETLKDVVAIVSEVEFVPIYIDQPLFGDVCSFLSEHGMMFHKFLGISGRTLKPYIINNDVNFPSQQMWSDALFVKSPFEIPKLSPNNLLKLAVLAALYNSPDVAMYCFNLYDKQEGTDIVSALKVIA